MERGTRKRPKSLTYVSLFSGAGGLDAGLRAIGANCLCAIEVDRDSCATLRLNGHSVVFESAIEDLNIDYLRTSLGKALNDVDLIVGGPPCQPFSKSALWSSKAALGLADQRATTLSHYLDYIEAIQPRAFILENVEGFVRWGGLNFLEKRLAELSEKGLHYTLEWRIVDAADYGVPQHRRRFIGVAMLGTKGFLFPSPSHGVAGTAREPVLTAWDALHEVELESEETLTVKGRWASLLPTIPPGRNYLWHTKRGQGLPLFGWRTRFWSFLLKLGPERPSPTLVASPSQNSGPFHWDNRLLSTRELAAIQTFPTNYQFAGARSSRQRQIGNAVPPLLAAVLGSAISSQLGKPMSVPSTLKARRATRPPCMPPLVEVPHEHLASIGSHADHPGTGRGPRPRPAQVKQADSFGIELTTMTLSGGTSPLYSSLAQVQR